MGYGDDIMGSGLCRGAAARGKRIALGDGKKIIWGPWSEEVFRHNPNIAVPGSENAKDIEWVHYYKGHRIYNRLDGNRWVWTRDWKAAPGEMYFDSAERAYAQRVESGFILFEPNLQMWKGMAVNKDWGFDRFQVVADRLIADGYRVAQFRHKKSDGKFLRGAELIDSPSFRHALAILQRAKIYVGVEGGLHHGAAAVGTRGVVVFGGFVSPQSTGYDLHVNLFSGGEACGKIVPCQHCRDALDAITVGQVYEAAKGVLN